MKEYLAKKGNSAIYLSRTEQIEEYRKKGFEIYEVEGSRQVCIAGPDMEPVEDIQIERKETGGLIHAE